MYCQINAKVLTEKVIIASNHTIHRMGIETRQVVLLKKVL